MSYFTTINLNYVLHTNKCRKPAHGDQIKACIMPWLVLDYEGLMWTCHRLWPGWIKLVHFSDSPCSDFFHLTTLNDKIIVSTLVVTIRELSRCLKTEKRTKITRTLEGFCNYLIMNNQYDFTKNLSCLGNRQPSSYMAKWQAWQVTGNKLMKPSLTLGRLLILSYKTGWENMTRSRQLSIS